MLEATQDLSGLNGDTTLKVVKTPEAPKAPPRARDVRVSRVTAQMMDCVQVSTLWPVIKASQNAVLPSFYDAERRERVLGNLLNSLTTGLYQCWALWGHHDGHPVLAGTAITAVQRDDVYEAHSLIVVSLNTHAKIGLNNWDGIFEPVAKFARKSGCEHLVAFSPHPGVKKIAETLGFEVEWRLVKKVVEG